MASAIKSLISGKQGVPKQLDILLFQTSLVAPYFSRIIFALKLIEKPEAVKTFAVDDKMRFYYNPQMFDHCSKDELVGALIHEVNHILREHLKRGKIHTSGKNERLFNIAADLEINPDIEKEIKLPQWVVRPNQFNLPDGQLAEWYYNKLMEDVKAAMKAAKAAAEANPGGGNCGSCADGEHRDWEDAVPVEVEGEEGYSETMQEFYRKATAEDIQEHANKDPGNTPGSLKRWADQFLKPKIDWKKNLRSTLANAITSVSAGMVDYSYQRRNRRQGSSKDIIFPGFYAPNPTIGIILDTSGSIAGSMMDQAIAEIGGVLKNTNAEVFFADVDHAVHSMGRIRSVNQLKVTGGGGTDMRLGYNAYAEHKPKPNIIICITDGYTPWPDTPVPGTKNIVVITSNVDEGTIKAVPYWAKVLKAIAE